MSVSLVFIETREGRPTPGSLGLLSHAAAIGETAAYVGGPDAAEIAATLAAYGAAVSWYCDDRALFPPVAGGHIDELAALISGQGYDSVLLENSVVAADIAAALAARLEAGVNWDLLTVARRDGVLVGTTSSPDEQAIVDVGWTGDLALAVVRAGTFEPVEVPRRGRVERIEPMFAPHSIATSVVARRTGDDRGSSSISEAEVVVAAGRGLMDRESLGLIEDLAAALDGAVAATLPLVDRGWCRHDQLVGLTGATIRPQLYLACGVSGAVGHRVGMERSEIIVAIDADPDAPIWSIADAGAVGDLHQIVPELTRLIGLRKRQS